MGGRHPNGSTAIRPGSTTIRPMLATAGPLPDGPGWAYEFAWDGARTIADVSPERIRLIGGDQGFAASCPELDVLRSMADRRLVLDGTIVVLDAFGRPSLPRLRRRMTVQRPSDAMLRRLPVAYYVFDVLHLDDGPTTDLPYLRRRELLDDLGLPGGCVALAPSFVDTDGRTVLDTAARYGLHGVVAKRAGSRYQPGRRTRSWVETMLRRTQEVVIGGWVPRGGSVGSLLVGVPTESGLHYVGRVGTGFGHAERHELADRLSSLTRADSPFVNRDLPEARWVSPELLAEVSYHRWTTAGRLERPVWAGLRPDRHPAAVQVPVLLPSVVTSESSGAGSGAGSGAAGTSAAEASIAELDEALRRARAEVDALRAQISPHFLYNVLSMITTYTLVDPPLARELLSDFADFTRYAFRTDVGLSTVADELEAVERYLNLQRARFGDRLRVDLQVAPAVLAVPLPFLAIQLAVEHAVQHSIELKPGGGTLTITAVDDGGACLVTVSDDGAGSDPGATLRSLDQRLRTAYGEHHGLLVESAPGTGTKLTFRIPAHP